MGMKLFLISSLSASMAWANHLSSKLYQQMAQQNVYGQALTTCSTDPMTGWTRDGTCKAYSNDVGTHVTCAELTWDFLEYSKSKGNDLMTQTNWGFPGLKEGNFFSNGFSNLLLRKICLRSFYELSFLKFLRKTLTKLLQLR